MKYGHRLLYLSGYTTPCHVTEVAYALTTRNASLNCSILQYLLQLSLRTSENAQNANFAMKLSEKSHERANLLAIKRLIAT
jgi:hypothetical protein